jgi:uncharacterized protein
VNCPKCKSSMAIVRFEEIEVDRCTACGGLWFDAHERERLKGRRGSEAIDSGDEDVGRKQNEIDAINCPRCTTRLVRMVDADQTHIWFEACSVCGGAYFDAGEFRDYKSWTPLDLFRSLFSRARR